MTTSSTHTTDRDQLAIALLRHQGLNDAGIGVYLARHANGTPGTDYYGEAMDTADAILAAGFTRASAIDRPVLEESLDTAEGWAVNGYSETSKAYWTGMRDTLRVVLGKTTRAPMLTSDDTAATTILGAQSRTTMKVGIR